MFLPVGDTPNPRGTPYLNYLLIGANVAVFLFVTLPLTVSRPDLTDPLLVDYLRAMGARGAIPLQAILDQVSAYDLFVFRYGFRPGEPSVLTLFTAMFLHGSWLHLAGNMLFLWIFGDNVEHRIGRFGYLLAYLGAGVAATLFFALFAGDSSIPLVGASGAISGILGLYFLWFPRNQVKVFIFLFPFIMNTFLVPARWVLGIYLVLDNLIPFLVNGTKGSGVAHGAHIGGFFAGLALAWWIERGAKRRRPAANRKASSEDGPSSGSIARRLGKGDLAGGAADYFALGNPEMRREVDGTDVLALGAFLLRTGDYDKALALYRRFISERPADPLIDQAYLGAGLALFHKPRGSAGAYQYFLAAVDATESPEIAAEARLHLREIEGLGEEG
jgi:membrane associated rhomboid family serine protease